MENEEVIEKRTVRHEDPVNKVTSVNVGADGTTNIQDSGDEVVEEERVVEEHVIEDHRRP